MERLTYRDKEGRAQWMPELLEDDSGLAGALIRDRLAAYEDTGLEPESFKRTFTEDALLILTGQLLGVTPDRLRELTQADREGRCVVLPCKIGDTGGSRMAEYIEREDAINLLWLFADESCASVVPDFENLPAADVAEVQHGRWVGIEYDGWTRRTSMRLIDAYKLLLDIMPEDDFCSYGQRKDDDHD